MSKLGDLRHEFREADEGMTTAEYAVGTVAAAGLGGLLIKIITSTEMKDLIWSVIKQAFGYVFG